MLFFHFQLLETVVKNCGDIVQMHVAEKGVLHEMLKIVKKKVIISRAIFVIISSFLPW